MTHPGLSFGGSEKAQRLEQVFFHLPCIDASQVILRNAIEDAESQALIKGNRICIFDGDMQMDAASSPFAQTGFQRLIERTPDRFAAELGQNLNGDEFPITRRLTSAAPSLKRRQADNDAGTFSDESDDRGVQQEKRDLFAGIGNAGRKAESVNGSQRIQVLRNCRTDRER